VATLWSSAQLNVGRTGRDLTLATNPVDRPTQEMVARAALIVVGHCLQTRSAWVENGRNLVTFAEIAVNEVVKGEHRLRATVILPGGIDANRKIPVAMTYPGVPTLTQGEHVVLFLDRHAEIGEAFQISDFALGKIPVLDESAAPMRRTVNSPLAQDGVKVVRRRGARVALDDFTSELRAYARQQP
jgi:hypothetical protein